jgi:hypothetical protein
LEVSRAVVVVVVVGGQDRCVCEQKCVEMRAGESGQAGHER